MDHFTTLKGIPPKKGTQSDPQLVPQVRGSLRALFLGSTIPWFGACVAVGNAASAYCLNSPPGMSFVSYNRVD